MPLQQKALTFPGKQIQLVYYPHKDASLPMKKVPPKESTNLTLKSLKCIKMFSHNVLLPLNSTIFKPQIVTKIANNTS